jgi:MFS family permease
VAGGPARGRTLLLLAMVLGLDTADLGSIGSIAGELEKALSLSNTQLGLLAAVPSLFAALASVPAGALADRTCRVRLLWIGMLCWGAAEGISALAGSYAALLLIRVALGSAGAVALPTVASLVGDLFPPAERARIWGLILAGELVGAAFGYLVAGDVASLSAGSWRLAFIVLGVPSIGGALILRTFLREPARGGSDRLASDRPDAAAGEPDAPEDGSTSADGYVSGRAQEEVRAHHVQPIKAQVLRSDPTRLGALAAARYVLRIRTNVVLIIASALGYFYFTGIATFGLVYFEDRFHVSHGVATMLLAPLALGGLAGVIVGGRLADSGLRRGRVNSRIAVGAWSFAIAALLFLPALLTSSPVIAVPLMTLAGVAFGGRDPPLDAARLDIMHHLLWGRAEAVRTLLRRTMTATAPIVFGVIADLLAPPGAGTAENGAHGFGANANGRGLELASLVLLTTLALGGLCTFLAMRTYPRDVATALASEAATSADSGSVTAP